MKFGVTKSQNKKKFLFAEDFCENQFIEKQKELHNEISKGDYKNSSLFELNLKNFLHPDRILPYVYFGILQFKGDWLCECYEVVQNHNEV